MKTIWAVLLIAPLLTAPAMVQAQFTYTTNSDGVSITITGYTGSGGAVAIPTNFNGFTVTSIGTFAFASSTVTSVTIGDTVTNVGSYAFEDCQRLTTVTIPTSVNTLSAGAFLGCSGLTSVEIPGNVTSIGSSAFDDCSHLTSVTIANGVASIEQYAFENCTGLVGVTIPVSVTNIGPAPFDGCSHLAAITVDSGNLFYTSTNGVLFDSSQAALIEYPDGGDGTYTIPPGITSIGESAFAFSTLTNSAIPESVTNIAGAPFAGCSLLTAITVDPGNSFYSSTNGVLFDKSGTILLEYPEGKGGNYSIPMGVITIESNAFSDCITLTNVSIPDSVATIGEYAFTGSGLRLMTIGKGVTDIGPYAFEGCTALASVTIPNSVTTIGNAAFIECTNLSTAAIPNSVTNLGTGVFDACYSLTSLTIGSGITNLGNATIAFCFSLTGVYFQGNAPAASSSAFRGDTATIYYLLGTTGWSELSAATGLTTVLWNPMIQANGPDFGLSSNGFGFDVTGTSNIPIVVQACANLASPDWISLQALTLTNGLFHFSEPFQKNSSARFYRISAP